ncbi:MAG: HNH endonuclease [Bacteroidales bacterium]|nr:HNH endonuclease [Bacteroidales bacterium]
MKIKDYNYRILENFDNNITVPDCIVVSKNKLGKGHGEQKLYISSKETMRSFFGKKGFNAKCFLLKDDLIQYMLTIKPEYLKPSQGYRGKDEFGQLWNDRFQNINSLEEIIFFEVSDQTQIEGPRGYVNSSGQGYQIIREISLPLVSYISVLKVSDGAAAPLYYWKLFVDYDALSAADALVFKYGKSKDVEEGKSSDGKPSEIDEEYSKARSGQGKYREQLLEECPFCPITKINDERLLIASHIKPWAASNNKERIDPHNGYMLSPMYDKLFDKGFISFTDDRKLLVSCWLSPKNVSRIGLVAGKFYQDLPVGEDRLRYLDYHRRLVFKG